MYQIDGGVDSGERNKKIIERISLKDLPMELFKGIVLLTYLNDNPDFVQRSIQLHANLSGVRRDWIRQMEVPKASELLSFDVSGRLKKLDAYDKKTIGVSDESLNTTLESIAKKIEGKKGKEKVLSDEELKAISDIMFGELKSKVVNHATKIRLTSSLKTQKEDYNKSLLKFLDQQDSVDGFREGKFLFMFFDKILSIGDDIISSITSILDEESELKDYIEISLENKLKGDIFMFYTSYIENNDVRHEGLKSILDEFKSNYKNILTQYIIDSVEFVEPDNAQRSAGEKGYFRRKSHMPKAA